MGVELHCSNNVPEMMDVQVYPREFRITVLLWPAGYWPTPPYKTPPSTSVQKCYQNGRQRSTSNFFVGAKTLKLSRKLFKFYYHIPHDMEMCKWYFQGFTEIQNGRHRSTFVKFYNHIPYDMEMCRWFYWNLKWPPWYRTSGLLLKNKHSESIEQTNS